MTFNRQQQRNRMSVQASMATHQSDVRVGGEGRRGAKIVLRHDVEMVHCLYVVPNKSSTLRGTPRSATLLCISHELHASAPISCSTKTWKICLIVSAQERRWLRCLSKPSSLIVLLIDARQHMQIRLLPPRISQLIVEDIPFHRGIERKVCEKPEIQWSKWEVAA
nr:hypothetical protein CFP56_16930 [Quercus suber]